MAKPDWGELQQRFLSDHAATGVSPKDWCEAQGLNYATARRHIKKPIAQSAQKSAQKQVRNAQKEIDVNALVENDGLTAQQRIFVAEYRLSYRGRQNLTGRSRKPDAPGWRQTASSGKHIHQIG